MTIHIVYKTDNVHSYASRDIIGVCIYRNPLEIIMEHANKEGETITTDDIYNINNISQTQNYQGDGEYHIETIQSDILI